MKKKKILRIIYTLNPNYGGISSAIIDNSISLKNNGFLVDILTCDPKGSKYQTPKGIKIINQGPGIGNYGFSFNLSKWLFKNKKRYDYFLIEGIWQYFSFLARIIIKKNYFVFIHGALDPFFSLNFFKKIKKKIYWTLIEKNNLKLSNSILLTSDEEKKLLKKSYVNTDQIKKNVIGFGILKPKINKKKAISMFYKKFPYLKNKFFLLYLGRFHEKKGCDLLIQATRKMKKNKNKFKILLVGPENEYKKKLKDLCHKHNLNGNLFWSESAIGGNLKYGAILASRGMVLFSRGENFGVSIVESLSLEKPVLITNKVNIYKEILKYDAGFVCRDKVLDVVNVLKKFINLDKSRLKKISKQSYKCFNDNFNLNSNNNRLAQLLKNQKSNLSNSS